MSMWEREAGVAVATSAPPPASTLKLDRQSDGYRVLRDRNPESLLARVRTCWHNADHADHVVTFEPMAREDWDISFSGGTITLFDLAELLAVLPSHADEVITRPLAVRAMK